MPGLRKPLDFSQVTVADLAYAAGIIDGEGCLAIVRQRYKTGPTNYSARAEVDTVDDCICPWLYKTFGGELGRKTYVWKGVPRLLYRWSVTHAQLEEFLRAIRPYLKLKGEIADALLACRATIGTAGQKMSEETREQRRLLYEHVKSLRLTQRAA